MISLGKILLDDAADQQREAPTPDQVEANLREAYAAFHAIPAETFMPGDVAWQKLPHLSPYKNADRPVIFIGYLDKPIDGEELLGKPAHLGYANAAATVDCRIGCMCGGDTFHLHLTDSRHLTATRPAPRASGEEETEATASEEAAADPAPAPPRPGASRCPAEAADA